MTPALEKLQGPPNVDETDIADSENSPPRTPSRDDEVEYPKGLRLGLIVGAIWLSLFLVGLASHPLLIGNLEEERTSC